MPTISLLELNRATLARQGLLERQPVTAHEMVERLIGMQTQAPFPPYTGLWSRIEGFAFDDLAALLESREVVRIVTLRGTVHLHTADDARMLRPFTQELIMRQFGTYTKSWDDFDPVVAEAMARERLAQGPATGPQLADALAERWPDTSRGALTIAPRCQLPLVQVPPRGVWGRTGPPTYALLDEWTGHPLVEPDHQEIVRRYLASFGPATPKDAMTWSGVRLSDAFTALADELIVLEGPSGEQLYDLPDAPRPPADTPAPVRLLPEWDNILLSHADRGRIIDAEHKPHVYTVNGVLPGTFTVDGRIAGIYKITAPRRKADVTTCAIRPFTKVGTADLAAVVAEAEALLAAMGVRGAVVTVDD